VTGVEVEILADGPALAGRAADLMAEQLAAAIGARSRATLAVSGGSTPAAFLAELADRPLPWEAVHIFQVDERVAPPGHAERNLTGLREALLDRVRIPAANVHPMPVEDPDLEAAAAAYAEEIRALTGPGGRLDVVHPRRRRREPHRLVAPAQLDVVHLGVGDDGHTASWPPGDPVVSAADDVAVVGAFNGWRRMTLTPPAINRAGWIMWLIAGSAKAPVVARLLAGDPAIPASRVRRHDATLLADAAAGADLTRPG
jgi:6-phosphogluconolactonase